MLTTRASTATLVDGWHQTLSAELRPLVWDRVAWESSVHVGRSCLMVLLLLLLLLWFFYVFLVVVECLWILWHLFGNSDSELFHQMFKFS